jgi:SAM-dependent methyltransferase
MTTLSSGTASALGGLRDQQTPTVEVPGYAAVLGPSLGFFVIALGCAVSPQIAVYDRDAGRTVSESLIYRSPTIYDAVMHVLYGRHARARLVAVAELVPPRARVVELCCGTARLYRDHLRDRHVDYLGLDLNPRFVEAARHAGACAEVRDVGDGAPLPPADVMVIQASLYHFLPEPERMVDRMLAAARSRVIVSEPVRNLSTSGVGLVAALARRSADPGGGGGDRRFDEALLNAFMLRYDGAVERELAIPGGRDKIFVLDAATAVTGAPEVDA